KGVRRGPPCALPTEDTRVGIGTEFHEANAPHVTPWGTYPTPCRTRLRSLLTAAAGCTLLIDPSPVRLNHGIPFFPPVAVYRSCGRPAVRNRARHPLKA